MGQLIEHGQAPKWVSDELHRACEVIERNMERFGNKFPSACAENGVYGVTENDDWTNGLGEKIQDGLGSAGQKINEWYNSLKGLFGQ